MTTEQILFFYAIGILFFVLGIEERETIKKFIYIVLSLFINLMGYESSYSNADFTGTAYLPLALMALSTIMLVYYGFLELKDQFSDDYKKSEEAD